ncbi:hypothetical protein K435DRAFT_782606 [Dendrothele bispora CBS 962.96]|uniref:Tetratricopeptide repeat protein 39B n=1 Tax=Dendrothele bispora (strain CBS 962.96) TaxID=1314807 RepID=A0A4S8LDW2_DENBC|nr:hypothetical protein K435DRAFT_782606 [Dendrothele bispora CBS 962.96]
MAETAKHSSNGVPITPDALQDSASVESKASQERASYQPHYASPPPVKVPYDPNEALDDIPGVSYALELFLASKMVESENYCNQNDEKKERLYFATGYGLIQCVKGLMSYEDEDLLSGIEHTKQGNLIAMKHRKKAASITSRLAGYVVSSLNSHGVGFIKSMTDVERHAELVYAESLFEKALLGIVYSGDWLAFIKEALNMRTTISVYRNLLKYVNTMDAESLANGGPPEDPSIDPHFRSGVYLGAGMATLILSLLPQKLLVIVELFGYKGDRKEALDLLCRAGGWSADNSEPAISTAQEGVRRSICDMALLIFHLVLSSFTFDGVDVSMAQKIIDWNLKRYSDGVFFLFGAGRLSLVRSQPRRAIGFYTRAMEVQSQYRNLHHISFWEIAIATLALWDLNDGLEAWKILQEEATWSKAIYSYGMAVCLLELADIEDRGEDRGEKKEKKAGPSSKEMREQAIKLMEQVPSLRQKIAGKSIPLEKLVARKARKFIAQGGRLTLPALELAYLFLGIAHAPRKTVQEAKMLAEVRRARVLLDKADGDPKKYLDGKGGYWDDLCLVDFLEGICLRYIAYPDPDAELDPSETPTMSQEEADKASEEAFNAVLKNGPRIELDHFLVYNTHYELGRLYACRGDTTVAKTHFDLVLSGKYLEVGPSGKKGRYSLENSLHLRTHAALEALHQNRL